MKQILLLASVIISSFFLMGSNCSKTGTTVTCTPQDPSLEEDSIKAFNSKSGFVATKLPSGIYYQIVDGGTGAQPTATSNVRCQYIGKLFDGTVFDSNFSFSGAQFNLSGVIQGWTIGIPLIKSGGKIRLMIPSKYAYGCEGNGSLILPNKPLFFEVTLLAVF